MWSHNTISRYGLLDAWPGHYAGKFGDDNENNVWSLALLFTSLRDATRAERPRVCVWSQKGGLAKRGKRKKKSNGNIIAGGGETNASVFDETQQPNDSLILVHFLISSVNEQFDQAELEVAGLRSGYMCVCADGFTTHQKLETKLHNISQEQRWIILRAVKALK